MAKANFGTGKSLVILAIVLGCFAVLWPKIFYPMMQTAFAMTSPKVDSDGRFTDPDHPPHLHPASVRPSGRGPVVEDVNDKFLMREGRPFPHPQARQPAKSQPKSGGAMSIIMPIYTVGIVVFFVYTVLKLVFKKPNEGDKKPLIKDFHMDPEYRKFVCQQSGNEGTQVSKQKKGSFKKQPDLTKTSIPEDATDTGQEMDSKDYEIIKLKKKLEETEQSMERIIKHMGLVNTCLNDKTDVEKKIIDSTQSDVRQRHKGDSRNTPEKSEVTKKCHVEEETERIDTLEDDLTELINLCNITDESVTNDADFLDDEEVDVADEKEKDDDTPEKSDAESVDDEKDEVEYESDEIGKKTSFSFNGCCKNESCA